MAASANDSSQRPLQNAMRRVKVAIQLDTGNRQKEAYCEYLRSVNYISHVMLQNALSKDEEELEVMELAKMVRLAEQCLERVKSCIENRKDCPAARLYTTTAPALTPQHTTSPPNTPPVLPTHQQSSQHTNSPPNTTDNPKASAFRASGDRGRAAQPRQGRVVSQGAETSCPFLPPEVFQRLQAVESQDSKKELTPIQEASRLNQKLKANYEARLSRLAPNQASQKTSLTLSLQRQMTENLIIAKAREEALCRKMEERRLRLQEQANRRFSSSVTMTPEEHEQRVLYANILEYEQDHDWPKVWKANLQKNPYDATLVSDLVTYLLSCPDHPVMKLLKKLQCEVYQRLYSLVRRSPHLASGCPGALKPSHSVNSLVSSGSPDARPKTVLVHSLSDASLSLPHDLSPDEQPEQPLTPAFLDRENSFEDLEQFLTELDWAPAHGVDDATLDVTFDSTHGDLEAHIQDLEERTLKEHLKDIVKDIHNAIDRVLALCLLSFECLGSASSKDQCVACIEEVFFMPIWSPLLVLFRKVHREREVAFENSVHLYRNASPGDIGVASKLYPKDTSLLHGSYPYECAVQELKQLCRDHCPQRKLECIVRTLRLICACAEHYRHLQENDPSPHTAAIGADDLLPILSYVALRSELPQLVSECAALEDFIHEGYLIGEEGYCLTSMQSALTYVESLHAGGV